MKKSLIILFSLFICTACQSSPANKESGYDGGKKERGVLSEYANKPLEDAHAVSKQSDERNQKLKDQLDF